MNKIQKEALDVLVEFHRVCVENDLKYSLAYGTLLGAVRHNGYIPWDDDVDVLMPYEDFLKYQAIARQLYPENNKDFFYQDHTSEKYYFNLFSKLRLNGKTEYLENSNDHIKMHRGAWIDIFYAVPVKESSISDEFFKVDKLLKNISLFTVVKPASGDNFVKKAVKFVVSTFNKLTYKVNPYLNKWIESVLEQIDRQYQSDSETAVVYSSYLLGNESDFKRASLEVKYFDNLILKQFEGHEFFIFSDYDTILTNFYGDYMEIPSKENQITHNIIEVQKK